MARWFVMVSYGGHFEGIYAASPGRLYCSQAVGIVERNECPKIGEDILVDGQIAIVTSAYSFGAEYAKDVPITAPMISETAQ